MNAYDFTPEEQEINKYKSLHPDWQVEIVRHPLPFVKAPVLQKCIESTAIKKDDIVFMVDVDVTFPPTILQIIRRYVHQGKRAVNPIVWYRDKDEHGNSANYYVGFAWGGIGIIALYPY